MSEIIQDYSYSGELVGGLFYQIGIPFGRTYDFPVIILPSGSIIQDFRSEDEGEEHLHAEVVADATAEHECLLNKSHVTGYTSDNYRADLFAGPAGSKVPKFVCDTFGTELVVNREFYDELEQSGLKGLVFEPLPIGVNQSAAEPELFLLSGGVDCRRVHTVRIPLVNVCPFCGWGPVVCPGCKGVTSYCPECERYMIVRPDELSGADDRRFTSNALSERGWVVEANRWDGSDLTNNGEQGIATGRFVDFAIRCEAVPFVAAPCLTDITGCNDEQLKRLEAARGDEEGRRKRAASGNDGDGRQSQTE